MITARQITVPLDLYARYLQLIHLSHHKAEVVWKSAPFSLCFKASCSCDLGLLLAGARDSETRCKENPAVS